MLLSQDDPDITRRSALYNALVTMGDWFDLNLKANPDTILSEIPSLGQQWLPYTPEKTETRRWGILLTQPSEGTSPRSADLKLGGGILSEVDFRFPIEGVSRTSEIKSVLQVFGEDLGRVRLVKLEAGGFFPPHRDLSALGFPDHFRVLLPLTPLTPRTAVLTLGKKMLEARAGKAYFLNAAKEHSLFCFQETYLLLMSVCLSESSVRKIISLSSY